MAEISVQSLQRRDIPMRWVFLTLMLLGAVVTLTLFNGLSPTG